MDTFRHGHHGFCLRPIIFAIHLALAGVACADPAANELPSGGQVVYGQASIQQQGARMDIQQATAKATLDWQTFNIGSQAQVNFQQPGADAVALNRVTQSNASVIQGKLTANGQVFLVNPAGVLFGKTAQVDVGGIAATTMSIRNEDFESGKYRFTRDGATAEVVNRGEIKAKAGGYVALIGSTVRNEGTIRANDGGTVALAAGDGAKLQFSSGRLVNVEVDAATVKTLVENKELIQAHDGRVILTAAAVSRLEGAAVRNDGTVEATSMTAEGGVIRLSGADEITNTGTLDASGKTAGGTVEIAAATGADTGISHAGVIKADASEGAGGTVRLNAAAITLKSASQTQATGKTGGGDIRVNAAKQATVEADASVDASAIGQGNGGTITVVSEGDTGFAGTAKAEGGANGGDGGLVETSGNKVQVGAAARVSTLAPHGKTGKWVLDPTDYTIAASGGNETGAQVAASLATTDRVITTTAAGTGGVGDINVNDGVSWGNANSLTLSAYHSVNVNQAITNTGTGGVSLRADNTGACVAGAALCGTVAFAGAGHVNVNGGNVSIYYNPAGSNGTADANGNIANAYTTPTDYSGKATLNNGSKLSAYMLVNDVNQLQSVNTHLGGTYALGKDIDASATSGWNAGTGFEPIGSGQFAGVFDGLDNHINNLFINRPASGRIGLFAFVSPGAVVRNVHMQGGSVAGWVSVGGLAGENHGTLTNVSNTGTVTGLDNFQDTLLLQPGDIGGLVGSNYGAITNSYSTSVVRGGDSGGGYEIGGVVGYAGETSIISASSHSTGQVSGQTDVGGLVGWNDGVVTGSNSNESVLGTYMGTSSPEDIGGLAGGLGKKGSVLSSYSVSTVSTGDWVGGLVGFADIGSTIRDSHHSIGDVTGHHGVGGLVGANGDTYRKVVEGFAAAAGGTIHLGGGLIDHSWSDGKVSGTMAVGGLAGTNGGVISYSSSKGSVVAIPRSGNVDLSGVTGDAAVGGLVGANGGDINHSSSEVFVDGGTVSSGDPKLRAAATPAGFAVGGLVGANGGSISDSSSSGNVTNGAILAGGLVGANGDITQIWGQFSPSGCGSGDCSVIFDNVVAPPGYASGLGAISNASSSGQVTGQYLVGGLVGSNGGDLNPIFQQAGISGIPTVPYIPGGVIVNVSSSGSVNGTAYVGGLLGMTDSSLSHVAMPNTVSVTASGDNVGGVIGYFAGDGKVFDNLSNAATVQGANNVGGLIGNLTGSGNTVSQSSNAGTVNGVNYVGGLVGFAAGKNNLISLSNNDGAVTGSGAVGGVAGLIQGTGNTLDQDSNSAAVTQRYAYATTGIAEQGVGGLVGVALGGNTINNSFNSASGVVTNEFLESTQEVTSYVGGLVGLFAGDNNSLFNDYNDANVSSSDAYGRAARVGGLVGGFIGGNGNGLNHVHNTGKVTNSEGVTSPQPKLLLGPVPSQANGADYEGGAIGGLVGYFAGSNNVIQDTIGNGSYNTGAVSSYHANVIDGTGYYGYDTVGGLVGYFGGGTASGNTINNAYNTGAVSLEYGRTVVTKTAANGATTLQGSLFGVFPVGGAVGYLSGNNNTVSHVNNYGSVNGILGVGGLIGLLSGNGNQIDTVRNSGAVASSEIAEAGEGLGFGVAGVVGVVEGDGNTFKNAHNVGNVNADDFAGGIFGYFYGNNNVVDNVSNTGTVASDEEAEASGFAIGGVAGSVFGSGNTFTHSFNAGKLEGWGLLGGIVGELNGDNNSIGTSYNTGLLGNATGSTTIIGGVAGFLYGNGNTIGDSYNTSAVIANSEFGGLVGQLQGDSNRIDQSYNTGVVQGTGDLQSNGGGLVGLVDGTGNTVSNSHNAGNVTGNAAQRLGGLVGGVNGAGNLIDSAYNTGNVQNAVVGGQQVGSIGGLVGTLRGMGNGISQSYNLGNVAGDVFVGGLVGYLENSGLPAPGAAVMGLSDNAATSDSNRISLSYNAGAVVGNSSTGGIVGEVVDDMLGTAGPNTVISYAYNKGSITGGGYSGGLVGKISADNTMISNAFNTGSVSANGDMLGGLVGFVSGVNNTAINNSYNTGELVGYNYVGGLSGRDSGYGSTIRQSFNTGSVYGYRFVGGLAGEIMGVGGEGANSSITDVFNFGPVGGTNYVGGIIGNLYCDCNSINNAYSTGLVIKTADSTPAAAALQLEQPAAYIGGLAGANNGKISNSFWDVQTSGQSIGIGDGDTTGATGLATADMMKAATFGAAGWNLPGIWNIVEGVSYPYLTWQFPTPPQIVSGTLTQSSALVGKPIQIAQDGLWLGQVKSQDWAGGTFSGQDYSGSNGFYYYALPGNSVPNGHAVLTWNGGLALPWERNPLPARPPVIETLAATDAAATTATTPVATELYNAAAVRLSDGGQMLGLDLLANYLRVSSNSQAAVSNADIARAKGGIVDPGIPFVTDGVNLTLPNGVSFQTDPTADGIGTRFMLGGNITNSGVGVSNIQYWFGTLSWFGSQYWNGPVTLTADSRLTVNGERYAKVWFLSSAPHGGRISFANGEVGGPFNLTLSIADPSANLGASQSNSAPFTVSGLELLGGVSGVLYTYAFANPYNNIGTLAADNTGGIYFANRGSLVVGSVGNSKGITVKDRVKLESLSGNIILNQAVTVTSFDPSGDPLVVLSAIGNFLNYAGPKAITLNSGGRWLVYSHDPQNDVFGGLDSGNDWIWNATLATLPPSAVTQPGNRYLFAVGQPPEAPPAVVPPPVVTPPRVLAYAPTVNDAGSVEPKAGYRYYNANVSGNLHFNGLLAAEQEESIVFTLSDGGVRGGDGDVRLPDETFSVTTPKQPDSD